MEFLANENFPKPSIQLLLDKGYKVFLVSEELSGISDMDVIFYASQRDQIILTFDKDYGEIIFRTKISNPVSVIFFRFKGKDPREAGSILLDLIENKEMKFENSFTVIEKDSIRQRKY
jgi:predicted nuclease of predicted toxin-antitoxin system